MASIAAAKPQLLLPDDFAALQQVPCLGLAQLGDGRLGGVIDAQELEDEALWVERLLDKLAQG